MSVKYTLQEYYILYLREVRKVSETTIRQYQNALNSISRFLRTKGKIDQSIYEIFDTNRLEELRNFLYQNPEFMAQNERGHRMYSAGLNNYLFFVNGDDFAKYKPRLKALDIVMPISKRYERNQNVWKRSNVIKKQTMKTANYLCEINGAHKTFIAESTKMQYMEGHHIIAMHLQDKFSYNLDVYANVVCLCPICHRLLHYGIKEEKEFLLKQLYEERKERLANSGIKIGKNDFMELLL